MENENEKEKGGEHVAPVNKIVDIRAIVEDRKAEEQKKYGDNSGGGGSVDITSAFIRECLRTNQRGDGELFKRINAGKFIYCKNMATWLKWAGHHWDIDRMGYAEASVEAVAKTYEQEAMSIKTNMAQTDKEQIRGAMALAGALDKRAEQLRGKHRRLTCLEFAHTSENSMAIEGVEIDSKPWLFACANGVIELKTGRFRSGRQDDYLLKASPVEWKGADAAWNIWENALLQIMSGNEEMVSFLRRLFGMSIVGKTAEKVFPVLTGPGGNNGKTTIIEAISYVLGPLAGPIQSEMLVAGHRVNSSGPTPDIMMLKGLRVAYASETEDGAKVSAQRVKLLTGGDLLTGRWPNDKFPTAFEPSHTLFLLSNFKPRADAVDKAFWARMINIPFTQIFIQNRDPVGENEHVADPHLNEKLKEQASGILAWLVIGCLEWQKNGLDIPVRVRIEGEDYQSGEDDIGAFIEYCTHKDETATTGATDLYLLFCKWWKRFVGNFPPKQKKFGGYLRDRYKSEKSGGVYKYFGIAINENIIDELDGLL